MTIPQKPLPHETFVRGLPSEKSQDVTGSLHNSVLPSAWMRELPAFRAPDPEHALAVHPPLFQLSRHGIISQKGFPNEFPAVVPFEQPAGIHVQGKEVSVQVRTMSCCFRKT
jgi:hypothetical protein